MERRSGIMTNLTRELIKLDEGCSKFAYQDSRGYCTIGYGRCIDERVGKGLSDNEIDMMLTADIWEATEDVISIFRNTWAIICDERRAALVSLRHNLGPGGFRGFKNMIHAIREDHWELAADELQSSKWFYQVGVRGPRLVGILRSGCFPVQ
jgi:lysozyme